MFDEPKNHKASCKYRAENETYYCENCKEPFKGSEKLRKHEQEECELRSRGGIIRGETGGTTRLRSCSVDGYSDNGQY